MQVDRRDDHQGWQIRDDDQPPGTGMIVTDGWLRSFGFGRPTRSNIDQIIKATYAAQAGYAPVKPILREFTPREIRMAREMER